MITRQDELSSLSHTSMTSPDLQLSLESSPVNSGNDRSQPDMADMNGLSDFTLDDFVQGTSDCMEMEGSTQIFNKEDAPDLSLGDDQHIPGQSDHVEVSREAQDSETFAPVSIFGSPSVDAQGGGADFFFASGSSTIKGAGLSDESPARDKPPFKPVQSGVSHYITPDYQTCYTHISAGDEEISSSLDGNAHAEEEYENNACQQGLDDYGDLITAEDDKDVFEDINLTSDGLDDGDPLAKKWDLRPQAGAKRGFTSTWMDRDESGNYDPEEDRKLDNARKARKRACRRRKCEAPNLEMGEGVTTESEEIIDEPTGDEQSRSSTRSVVVLTLTTEKCIDAFKNIVASSMVQQGTRRRCRNLQNARQFASLDPVELPADLKNKPIARCCWSCANAAGESAAVVVGDKAECSLATDPTQWPCKACLEVGVPCALITEPIRKLACEDCRRQRIACSFSSTRNHRGPCQQCKTVGHQCIAGPVKESIVPRLEYVPVLDGGLPVFHDDKELTYTCNATIKKNRGKKRRPVGCVECSRTGVDCVYGSDWGACHACKCTDQACTIPDKHLHISKVSTPVESSGPITSMPEEVYQHVDVPLCDGGDHDHGPHGKERIITTNFSHPIGFNCDDDEPRKECCLCACPALQVVGFGKRGVSVIDYDDSSGFVEIADGHGEDTIEPTTLCTECTTSRMTIVMCGTHQMTPISAVTYTTNEEERALHRLFDDELQDGDVGAFCSICPGLATLGCNASQEDGPNGCGLKLCAHCTAILVGRYEGDLGVMLAREVGVTAEGRGFGFRADVEFLRNDGVLVRYLTSLIR